MKSRLLLVAIIFAVTHPSLAQIGAFSSMRRPASLFERMFPAFMGRTDLIPLAQESGLYAAYGIMAVPGRVGLHPRVQGPFRMLGGGLEAFGGGYYAGQTGGLGGVLGGGLLMANGADNFWAGWQMFSTGQYQEAYLEQAFTGIAGPGWGEGLYGLSQFGMVGSPFAGARLNSFIRALGLPPNISISRTTVLGENMLERVIPFANQRGFDIMPFGVSKTEWDILTPRMRWKVNDSALRARINAGDAFCYIGIDPERTVIDRMRFDLTGSELLRLQDRGIPYDIVSPIEVNSMLDLP